MLEGSVQRAGSELRINVQLIDTTTGGHLWAERYDGDMGDIFELQDTITEQIVTALAVKLDAVERDDLARRSTESVGANDYFLVGRDHLFRRSKDDNIVAATLF